MQPIKKRVEAAMAPAIGLPSDAAYEALVAGSNPNAEYQYTAGKGFEKTNKPNATPNVFSTFLLTKDNEVTAREIYLNRVKYADEYQKELQDISSVVSRDMGKYFDKSSWLGTPVDLFAFSGQGLVDFTNEMVNKLPSRLPDTVSSLKARASMEITRDRLTDQEFENVEYALSKTYAKFKDPKYVGQIPTLDRDQLDSAVSHYNVDKMVGKDGKPLTETEKQAVKAFQENIISRFQMKRNEMADAFYRTYSNQLWADSIYKPGMGATNIQAIGNFAGDAFGSMMTFGAVGFLPKLSAAKAAYKASISARWLRFAGVRAGEGASRSFGTAKKLLESARKYENAGNTLKQASQLAKAEKYASQSYRLRRNADLLKGVGLFASKNLPKVAALGSMTGTGLVFSQAFLVQANETATTVLAKGGSWEKAFGAGLANGFTEGAIETLVGFRFLNRFLTREKSFKNFLTKAVLPEGLEESSQTLATHAIKKAVGMDDATFMDIAAETLYSFIGGALGGAMMGSAHYSTLSAGYNRRLVEALRHEKTLKASGKIDSNLAAWGEQRRAINQKYAGLRKDILTQRKAAQDAAFKEIAEKEKDQKAVKEQQQQWLESQRESRRAEDAQLMQQRQQELANALEALRQQKASQQQNKDVDFTAEELELLEMLRGNYEEAAKKVNPEITLEQLEQGWNGVRDMLIQEGYTGQFSTAVQNMIDNMISFAQGTEKNVQLALENLSNRLGFNKDEKSIAARLTSKDEIEKYNAELDAMEDFIIQQFRLAGAEAQGKGFAKIFRNQIGYLPMFALDENGDPMTPLAFYQAIKPHLINVQNALMHNEIVPNVDNIMMKAVEQSDSVDDYKKEDGTYDYAQAYEKYAGVWELIKNYDVMSKEQQQQALVDINLALFNAYNYTDNIDFIKDYIANRALKEGAILREMGLLWGSQASDDDLCVFALMRQKDLPFAFCARAAGIVSNFNEEGRSEAELNKKYNDTLNDLYPNITDEDRVWLNRMAKADVTGLNKAPKYRDFTYGEGNAITYNENTQKKKAPEEEQAQADILAEEGEMLVEEAPAEESENITITAKDQQMMDNALRRETGQTSRYIAPNSLYSRNGRVILVINNQEQGEFLHEAGHYLITEFLLNNMEMANIVGDKAYGPINQLLIQLYDAVKGKGGKGGLRLSAIQKQETILDALMDFIRTDGHTGDSEVDAILTEIRSTLNQRILHPEGSKLERMSKEQRAQLSTAVKNLFKPSTGIQMLNDRVALENAIHNSTIDEAAQLGLQYLEKYAVPDSDFIRYVLENPMSDTVVKMAALSNLQTQINMQALSLLMSNTDEIENKAIKLTTPKTEAEDIQENQVFFFKPHKDSTGGAKEARFIPARSAVSWKQRGEDDFNAIKEFVRHPLSKVFKFVEKHTKAFRSSLIEIAREVSPELGNKIQNAIYKDSQRVAAGQEYGKLFIDALNKQNKTDSPISQEEYDINFVDKLNNMKNEEARAWLLERASTPELKEQFQTAFDGMIMILNSLKMQMQELEVNANWIEDGQFFPRSIKDYQAFSEGYLNLAEQNIFAKVVDISKINEGRTSKERAEIEYHLQRMFNNMVKNSSSEQRVTFLQNRIIKEVTPEMRKYYEDPIDAYMKYVEDASRTILTRELVGASHDKLAALQADENYRVSELINAGVVYDALKNAGAFNPERIDLTGMDEYQRSQVREQQEKLKTFYKALHAYITRYKETGKFARATNDLLSVTMLAHPSTALSQGQEMITTAWLFGLKNTATAAYNALKGKKTISIEELGIDELEDAYKSLSRNTLGLVTDASLKYSGFKLADVYFKNVALNAIYNYFDNALKDPSKPQYKEAMDRIKTSFEGLDGYEARVVALIEDIKNKRLSDDVKYLMFDTFAHQQPINAANISFGYNASSPLGRLCLYKFNTVAYRQLNAICGRLKESWMTQDSKGNLHLDAKKGLAETLRLMMFLALIGVPLDVIKDILSGRFEFSPGKSYMFSVGQCFLLNEYDAKTLSQEGLGSFFNNKLAAPLTPLNWISQDIWKTAKGDFSMKTLKGVPVFGRGLHSAVYALHDMNNDGIGFNVDFLNNDASEYWWG